MPSVASLKLAKSFCFVLGLVAMLPAASAADRGLGAVIARNRAFVGPPETPAGKTLVYQVALPFQLSADKAALFCNVRESQVKGLDYEVGADVIIFDSVTAPGGYQPVPLTRLHHEVNPNTRPPRRAAMVKYPARGGFIPLGAKRADGTPFPHAGTGFAVNVAAAWDWDTPDSVPRVWPFKDGPPWHIYTYMGKESYGYIELHQLTYDGKEFRVVSSRRVNHEDLLPGWIIGNGGVTNAIPSGNDLLVGMVGRRVDGKGGSGIMRWRFLKGEWTPVDFTLVPGTDSSFEPSLVRDLDGSLFFLARDSSNDIRIRRSADEGKTWTTVVHAAGLISRAPVSLNRAANGTLYVAANLYQVVLQATDKIHLYKSPQGRINLGGATRNAIYVWPLNEKRDGLGVPLKVRDCLEEWGSPASGSVWRLDHPVGATVRLADGRWHTVLASRVLDFAEALYAAPPTERTGTYLDEIISEGEPVPVWNF